MSEKVKENIKKISNNSGVYIFKDKSGKILYIGKATNLKSRVSSYFSSDANLRINANPRIANRPIETAIEQIAKIETIETDSVLEALILESNLIKKHQPKYNVDLKDDKSFSYAVVTKEIFPRILIFRGTDIDFNKLKAKTYKLKAIFGPYTSKKQLEIALKIIRKIFPYHSNRQQTEKGCLDFQIGLCSGPYAGAISKTDYFKNIRNIKMILEGKKKNLVKRLEIEMKELSKKNEFEKAANIRNKIFALQHIRDIALINKEEKIPNTKYNIQNTRIEAYDISNISGQYAVGSMVVFKNNEPDKSQYRKFKIKTVEGADDVGMMREVLLRRFNNNWPKPDLILLDGGQGHLGMYKKLMQELKLAIPAIAVAKGAARKNLDLRCDANLRINANPQITNILKDKNLIKQIMDEAHRFAIGYHRKLRKREFI